jgi:hypothetical protein
MPYKAIPVMTGKGLSREQLRIAFVVYIGGVEIVDTAGTLGLVPLGGLHYR